MQDLRTVKKQSQVWVIRNICSSNRNGPWKTDAASSLSGDDNIVGILTFHDKKYACAVGAGKVILL